jgi:hypothetical protein
MFHNCQITQRDPEDTLQENLESHETYTRTGRAIDSHGFTQFPKEIIYK